MSMVTRLLALAAALWAAALSGQTPQNSGSAAAGAVPPESNEVLTQNRIGAFLNRHERQAEEFLRQGRESKAWEHCREILDYWAASSDLECAREEYLRVFFGLFDKGFTGKDAPLSVWENAVKIARAEEDQAYAHYLLAQRLCLIPDRPHLTVRVGGEFEAAIRAGPGPEWYPGALFHYARWASSHGRSHYDDKGDLILEPDYEKALALYRRLLELPQGKRGGHAEQARKAAEEITRPFLRLFAEHAYAPGAEPSFRADWRNLGRAEAALYPVHLTKNLELADSPDGAEDWLESVSLSGKEPLAVYPLEKEPRAAHYPVTQIKRLETAPGAGEEHPSWPAGAYVLEARSGKLASRDLLLVTDLTLILKTAGGTVLAYLCGAEDGAPVPQADVRLLVWDQEAGRAEKTAVTDADGLAVFRLDGPAGRRDIFAAAALENRQAFALLSGLRPSSAPSWRVHAYAAQPVYRPGETVRWKVIARRLAGEQYTTPSGRRLSYEIRSPAGYMVLEGVLQFNDFGSAKAQWQMPEKMAAGEYRIFFREPTSRKWLDSAMLFRIEEPPAELSGEIRFGGPASGHLPAVFPMGEPVAAEIKTRFPSGGAAPNTPLEARLWRKPFSFCLPPLRPFDWHGSFPPSSPDYQLAEQRAARTDSTGTAFLQFETPQSADSDYDYILEIFLAGSGPRKGIGQSRFRVTRQNYFIQIDPEHHIRRPGETAEAVIRCADAWSRPVSASGRLRLTREEWEEVWVDRKGKQISGERIRELRQKSEGWFSFGPSASDYRLLREGYITHEIETARLKTGGNGRARYSFIPSKKGFYRLSWFSRDRKGQPVKSEATIWVSGREKTSMGYRPGGLRIIPDQDTARQGGAMPILLAAPAPGRSVLFTAGAGEMLHWQLVRMEGTSKLIQAEIRPEYAPNAYFEAVMISERQFYHTRREITVPPEDRFLKVSITSGEEGYEPLETGRFVLTAAGTGEKPAAAELSFVLADERYYPAIFPDEKDIRRVLFGRSRPCGISTSSTLAQKPYPEFGRPGTVLPAPEIRAEEFPPRESFPQPAAGPAHPLALRSLLPAAHWQPQLLAGEDGTTEVEAVFPEKIASWRVSVVAVAAGAAAGQAETVRQTRLPLISQLSAPRYALLEDEFMAAGILSNNTRSLLSARATLAVSPELENQTAAKQTVPLPEKGQERVSWRLKAKEQGNAQIQLDAAAGEYYGRADAAIPIYPPPARAAFHYAGWSMAGQAAATGAFPESRRKGSARLEIQVTPSLAVVMLDALAVLWRDTNPTVENRMSRLMAAAAVIQNLDTLGFPAPGLLRDILDTSDQGSLAAWRQKANGELAEIIRQQHVSGGWGWWEGGEPDPFISAYVFWGLVQTRRAGLNAATRALEKARAWLESRMAAPEQPLDLKAWILHALTSRYTLEGSRRSTRAEGQAFLELMKNRKRLGSRARALLILSALHFGFGEDARLLMDNLKKDMRIGAVPEGLEQDGPAEMKLVYWGGDGHSGRWADNAAETTSFALMALLALDPGHELAEPAGRWLAGMRRGLTWRFPRETAAAVLSLNRLLKATGEMDALLEYELTVDGQTLAMHNITLGNVLEMPSVFTAREPFPGGHRPRVEIRRLSGQGPIYYSVSGFFLPAAPVRAAPSGEFSLARRYYRITSVPTLLKGFAEEKHPLGENEPVRRGDRVEAVLAFGAAARRQYLELADALPAGLEVAHPRDLGVVFAKELAAPPAPSASPPLDDPERYTGREIQALMQKDGRNMRFFIPFLEAGSWEIRYPLRAACAGRFHVPPAVLRPVHIPGLQAATGETLLQIEEPLRIVAGED